MSRKLLFDPLLGGAGFDVNGFFESPRDSDQVDFVNFQRNYVFVYYKSKCSDCIVAFRDWLLPVGN